VCGPVASRHPTSNRAAHDRSLKDRIAGLRSAAPRSEPVGEVADTMKFLPVLRTRYEYSATGAMLALDSSVGATAPVVTAHQAIQVSTGPCRNVTNNAFVGTWATPRSFLEAAALAVWGRTRSKNASRGVVR